MRRWVPREIKTIHSHFKEGGTLKELTKKLKRDYSGTHVKISSLGYKRKGNTYSRNI